MAKRKEKELSYLQSPLPEGQKYYKTTKVSFSGLNKRNTLDTGVLSCEKNISTVETPYLTPAQRPYLSLSGIHVISMFGFDDFLVIVHKKDNKIHISYADDNGIYATGVLADDLTTENTPRSIVQFNVYDAPTDVLSGEYVKKLLVFPDKKSLDFTVERNYTTPTALSVMSLEGNGIFLPDIKYATVHLSRVFGLDDGRVYASGFNDYANWNLDTAEEYNESNAWCSPAQANVRADSTFTGITTYQNHVVCFKRNFMHEIYNTKNPFRIQDIYAEGAIDNRTIQDVDGRLIFVSDDYVKVYTGSNPQIISYELNIPKYTHAISGNDGRNYYLYAENGENKYFFVYDTLIGEWSERSLLVPSSNSESTFDEVSGIKAFASNKNGMYMATDNAIYKLNSGIYTDVPWSFETDTVTNNTVDVKHIKKLQMLCDFADADMDVYILYDDEEFKEDNPSVHHKVFSSKALSREKLTGRFPIRIKPIMTAHYGFKLHFEGKGYVKLYELEISAQQGGELFV